MNQGIRTSENAPENFFAITPSDATLLQGLQYLYVVESGNLVIKGAAPGSAPRTWPVTAGQVILFGAGYVMAATDATVDGAA